jgi:hypothetical protein
MVTDVKHGIVGMLGREGQDANVAFYRPTSNVIYSVIFPLKLFFKDYILFYI